jgi:hypothetical protein
LAYWAQSFHCQQFDPHTLPSDPGIGDNICIGSRTAVNMPSFPGVLRQMRDSTPGYQYVSTKWLDLHANQVVVEKMINTSANFPISQFPHFLIFPSSHFLIFFLFSPENAVTYIN